jgi:hypothetical protein
MEPSTPSPVTLSWIRRRVREQHTSDWTSWFDKNPKPKTYAAPFRRRLDDAYTTLPRKLSSAVLGLRTGHGYFLDCLAQPPTDTYPTRNCTCPLHPPQSPKHLLLSCPEHRTARETLRRDLKLGRLTRQHLSQSSTPPPDPKPLLPSSLPPKSPPLSGHTQTPHGNGDPPPAFATTSTETIDFSIAFGFAALIYVPL